MLGVDPLDGGVKQEQCEQKDEKESVEPTPVGIKREADETIEGEESEDCKKVKLQE